MFGTRDGTQLQHPPVDELEGVEEMRRADPALRRRAMMALVAAVALILAGVTMVERHLDVLVELAEHDFETASQQAWRMLVLVVGAGFMLLVILLGFSLRFAALAYAKRSWPPDGVRVLRDTMVVRGKAARVKAVSLMVYALVLACLGMAMLMYLYSLYRLLIWPGG
jgi:hypothetical protein